jgi:hypothetical protein
MVRVTCWLLVSMCLWPSVAGAQSSDAFPGWLALDVGVRWTSATTIGTADAIETTPGGGRFQLFTTNTAIAPAIGIDSSIGVRLTRSLEAEASASFTKSDLRTKVGADAEGASGFTAAESLKQITVEGSLVFHLTRMRLSARSIPYLSGGAGFLRDLHEGNTLGENGRVYHVGAGLHYFLKSSATGVVNALGIRLDGRAVARSGGTSFDDDLHLSPAVSASLFARF